MRSFRTEAEKKVGKNIEKIFERCPDPLEIKLENFTKYVRRQHLKRFLALYEIFKIILPVKGSIVECGVWRGFSLMAWAKLSAMLEPENLTRRVYGFDAFQGFPSIHAEDQRGSGEGKTGDFGADAHEELLELVKEYDTDRFLGHIGKVELIKGDMAKTIPEFVKEHPHLVVSLLFVDCDLYEPTKAAIENFLPRMPKGAVIAFDDLDNPTWPGETTALLETSGMNTLKIRRLEWDPYIGFAVVE